MVEIQRLRAHVAALRGAGENMVDQLDHIRNEGYVHPSCEADMNAWLQLDTRGDELDTNSLSGTILLITHMLINRPGYESAVELLIQAAHGLYLCPDCEERPCKCELPFS
jgi:hypothetical protein